MKDTSGYTLLPGNCLKRKPTPEEKDYFNEMIPDLLQGKRDLNRELIVAAIVIPIFMCIIIFFYSKLCGEEALDVSIPVMVSIAFGIIIGLCALCGFANEKKFKRWWEQGEYEVVFGECTSVEMTRYGRRIQLNTEYNQRVAVGDTKVGATAFFNKGDKGYLLIDSKGELRASFNCDKNLSATTDE